MKRLFNILPLVALLFGAVALGSCTNDLGDDNMSPNGGGSSDCIVLNFDAPQSDVVIQTRAQNLDDQNENRVRNLYVFIFDTDGHKVYSYYFDSSNKVDSFTTGLDGNYWLVENTSDASTKPTTGKIMIRTTSKAGADYSIYAITNLDSSFVDISSDRLSQIQTEEELLRTQGKMLQQTVSRSGYLQMSGKMENVNIDGDGNITHATDATLHLYHMDAKVQVTLKQGAKVKNLDNATIQIINVPNVGYVWPRYATTDATSTGLDAVVDAEDTFDSPVWGFDNLSQDITGTINTYDAWFYMLESRQTPKQMIPMECPDAAWEAYDPAKTNYNPYFERARQTKDKTPLTPGYGHNELDGEGNKNFMYANNLSPYMLVKCSVDMELEGDEAGQELGGDMTYLIPLGDAGSSASPVEVKVNNYNTNRNTFYHYTVTVNGVHNVRVEVDARGTDITPNNYQMEENQPGASGKVVVAKEEIAICDCHYVTKTITFHAINVSENLTWSVSTPFGEGGPQIDIEGNDVIPPGLDYEWVHFRVNAKIEGTNTYYETKRRAYTIEPYDPVTNPGGLMNVSQLVKYMKEQKKLYDTEDPAKPELWTSDFDNGRMEDIDDVDDDGNTTEIVNDPDGRKICVTAFVNEFYYDYNPLNPLEEIPADFWKQYVNYPTDRYMYILSESNLSRDEESRATGSVVTIQQRPIQSVYDTNPANTTFDTAWGLEETDEFPDIWSYWSATGTASRGNTSDFDGRLNTMKEWELVNPGGTAYTAKEWDDYMDFEVRNEVPQLKSNYQYLRYSCMTRNRDNDGDNIIDPEEVRWYMAATKQLMGMAFGRDVIKFNSRLYHRTSQEMASSDRWRQHVISSTASGSNASNNPTTVWGEEVTSVSTRSESTSWADVEKWTIRCVRNLGTEYAFNAAPPVDVIEVKTDGEFASSPQVTCVRINPKALRAQQNTELVYGDENTEQNRLSMRFYLAPTVNTLPTVSGYNEGGPFYNHNKWIEDVGSSVETGHCPEGYRMPNMLELTVMFNYLKSYCEGGYFCRNYYSFGTKGMGKETKSGWSLRIGGWGSDAVQLMNNGDNVSKTRCVRDASVDELRAEGLM